MPVYTYRCSSCGVKFERHQSFTDAPLRTCPECKKKSLKKVITPSKVIFKGSGFYATDNKSPSGEKSRDKSRDKSSSEDKSASEDKSPSGEKSSTESKSEKKSESKTKESKSSEKSE